MAAERQFHFLKDFLFFDDHTQKARAHTKQENVEWSGKKNTKGQRERRGMSAGKRKKLHPLLPPPSQYSFFNPFLSFLFLFQSTKTPNSFSLSRILFETLSPAGFEKRLPQKKQKSGVFWLLMVKSFVFLVAGGGGVTVCLSSLSLPMGFATLCQTLRFTPRRASGPWGPWAPSWPHRPRRPYRPWRAPAKK